MHEGELFCFENETKKSVNSEYVLQDSIISFIIGDYDNSQTIIIDPPLDLFWATYYGESDGDKGRSITSDQNRSVFITGLTASNDLPTHNSD